jgi:hypothetical protein
LDGEVSAIKAFVEVFKGCTIVQCLTHFSATIYRHIIKFDLYSEFRNNKSVFNLIRCIKSLVFVPNEYFTVEFEKIKSKIAILSDNRLSNFITNFKKQFVIKSNNMYVLKKEYQQCDRILNA